MLRDSEDGMRWCCDELVAPKQPSEPFASKREWWGRLDCKIGILYPVNKCCRAIPNRTYVGMGHSIGDMLDFLLLYQHSFPHELDAV
jgi:hypothetical protein